MAHYFGLECHSEETRIKICGSSIFVLSSFVTVMAVIKISFSLSCSLPHPLRSFHSLSQSRLWWNQFSYSDPQSNQCNTLMISNSASQCQNLRLSCIVFFWLVMRRFQTSEAEAGRAVVCLSLSVCLPPSLSVSLTHPI